MKKQVFLLFLILFVFFLPQTISDPDGVIPESAANQQLTIKNNDDQDINVSLLEISGHYKAFDSFDLDQINTDPQGFDLLFDNKANSGYSLVKNEFQGHKKVVEFSSILSHAGISKSFDNPTSDIVEFYVAATDITDYFQMVFYDGATALLYFGIYNSLFQYYYLAWRALEGFSSANTWYHVTIELNTIIDAANITINSNKYYNVPFMNPGSQITQMNFRKDTGYDSGSFYIDAFDSQSLDSSFYLNRNLELNSSMDLFSWEANPVWYSNIRSATYNYIDEIYITEPDHMTRNSLDTSYIVDYNSRKCWYWTDNDAGSYDYQIFSSTFSTFKGSFWVYIDASASAPVWVYRSSAGTEIFKIAFDGALLQFRYWDASSGWNSLKAYTEDNWFYISFEYIASTSLKIWLNNELLVTDVTIVSTSIGQFLMTTALAGTSTLYIDCMDYNFDTSYAADNNFYNERAMYENSTIPEAKIDDFYDHNAEISANSQESYQLDNQYCHWYNISRDGVELQSGILQAGETLLEYNPPDEYSGTINLINATYKKGIDRIPEIILNFNATESLDNTQIVLTLFQYKYGSYYDIEFQSSPIQIYNKTYFTITFDFLNYFDYSQTVRESLFYIDDTIIHITLNNTITKILTYTEAQMEQRITLQIERTFTNPFDDYFYLSNEFVTVADPDEFDTCGKYIVAPHATISRYFNTYQVALFLKIDTTYDRSGVFYYSDFLHLDLIGLDDGQIYDLSTNIYNEIYHLHYNETIDTSRTKLDLRYDYNSGGYHYYCAYEISFQEVVRFYRAKTGGLLYQSLIRAEDLNSNLIDSYGYVAIDSDSTTYLELEIDESVFEDLFYPKSLIINLFDSSGLGIPFEKLKVYLNGTRVTSQTLAASRSIEIAIFDYLDNEVYNTTHTYLPEINININYYKLTLKNKMYNETVIYINSTYSFELLPYDSESVYLKTGSYNISWTDDSDNAQEISFNLIGNSAIGLNTTYHLIYFSLYDTSGLGLTDETVKFYINNKRSELGPNWVKGNTILLTVKDYLDSTLYNVNVAYADEISILIDVYEIVLWHNFTDSMVVKISRDDVAGSLFDQEIGPYYFFQYKFLAGRNYTIDWYFENGTIARTDSIELNETRHIEFGFYSGQLTFDDIKPEINDWILVTILLAVIIVALGIVIIKIRNNPLQSPKKRRKKLHIGVRDDSDLWGL